MPEYMGLQATLTFAAGKMKVQIMGVRTQVPKFDNTGDSDAVTNFLFGSRQATVMVEGNSNNNAVPLAGEIGTLTYKIHSGGTTYTHTDKAVIESSEIVSRKDGGGPPTRVRCEVTINQTTADGLLA